MKNTFKIFIIAIALAYAPNTIAAMEDCAGEYPLPEESIDRLEEYSEKSDHGSISPKENKMRENYSPEECENALLKLIFSNNSETLEEEFVTIKRMLSTLKTPLSPALESYIKILNAWHSQIKK